MNNNWNLKELYKNTNDPQIEKDIQACIEATEGFANKWLHNNKYTEDPTVLLQAIQEYENLEEMYGECTKPHYYFTLLNSLDQTNTEIKGQLNKIEEIAINLLNKKEFFTLKISQMTEEKQQEALSYKPLENYYNFLKNLFKIARYALSEKEEKIFNITQKTSYSNWINMMEELLNKQKIEILQEDGSKKTIPYNEISRYLTSRDKNTREYAGIQFNTVNDKYAEIAEFEINSILEYKKSCDSYRGILRPDELRHLSDDISTEVVDKLVEVVTNNFALSQSFYKLKAEMLGQETLGYHERNVPILSSEKFYSIEDSFNLVKKSFKKLDPYFEKAVDELYLDSLYDIYPKDGKTGGAFCISVNRNLPVYILLNHNNKINDALTLAHESGHAIHAFLARKQTELNSGHSLILAECASTFFEDFVLEEIINESDGTFRTEIVNERIHQDISTIFRQVALYNFEKELHTKYRENGYINREKISEIFCKHMHTYLGESVDIDDGMRNGWIYWSHIRNFFYVYSYAGGLLISKALQKIVKDDKSNINIFKKILESGSSKSPDEILKEFNLDMTKDIFWEKGLAQIKLAISSLKNSSDHRL